MENHHNIAVLIDVENANSGVMPDVSAFIKKFKGSSLIRAYADWTKENLTKWQKAVMHYGINPIHQPSFVSGKNSSDITLTIDAMDLLYSGKFGTFLLVTSDSDFVRLVIRLKESGAHVIGIGENKTSPAFRLACNQFIIREKQTTEEACILDIWPDNAADWISVSLLAQYWKGAGHPSLKGHFLKMLKKHPQYFLLKECNKHWTVKRRKGVV